jgi:hypothetical protein
MQTTKLSRFWTYSDTYDFGVSLLQRFVGGLKLFIGLFCFLVLIGKYTSRADVLTYHYDKARTGLNSQETILAPELLILIRLDFYFPATWMEKWTPVPYTFQV